MTEYPAVNHPIQSRSSSSSSSSHNTSLPSLRLGINKKTEQDDDAISQDHVELRMHWWSDALHQFWRQSLLRATFSPNLPQTEETEFEEKFKYMIVISPFISSSTPSISLGKNKGNSSSPHMTTGYSTPATRVSRAGKVGTAAVMTGLLTSLGVETIMMIQQRYDENIHEGGEYSSFRPIMSGTTLATASMAFFFIYRHKRRSDIRQLYHTALISLKALMEQCDALDTKVSRSILMIEEVESLRRGRSCTHLRSCLQAVLRRIFIRFEEAIIDLADHVNKSTLSHLYDMYNIRFVASLSSMDHLEEDQGPERQDTLRTLWRLVHAKRRECMIQFLALNIVSEAHDSERKGYTESWNGINQILASLGNEIKSFVADIMDILETELYVPALDSNETNSGEDIQMTVATDRHLKPFVDNLEVLDRQIRTLQAKFYVCRNDAQELAIATANVKGEDNAVRGRLKQEYQSIELILGDLLSKWQEGQDALLAALDAPDSPGTASLSSSPAIHRRHRMSFPHNLDLKASRLSLDATHKNEDILPLSPVSMG